MGERLTLLLPRLGFGALVVAAFLVPIAYNPLGADLFTLPKAVVSWVAVVVAVVGVVVWAASVRRLPFGRLRILLPLGLLIGWTAIATVLSPQPLVSLMGQYGRYDGLAALVTGAAAALALVAYTAADPGRLRWIAVALAAGSGVGVVAVALDGLGVIGSGWTVPGLDLDLVGLGGNPNFSGALLAMAVPILLGLGAVAAERRSRIALCAAAAVLAGGVLWTGTRGGLVALFGGIAAFGWLAPDLLSRWVRWAATALLVASLGLVLASSASDGLAPSVRVAGSDVFETTSLGQREFVWAGTARVAAADPVVGVGPDALALRFPYERGSRGGAVLIESDEAHDVYLDRAATSGVPGLLLYLWLIGTVAVLTWRRRERVAPEHRWLVAAFGGGLACYLLQGVFSIDMVPLAFVSWLCVGALVSLTDPAAKVAVAEGARARPVPVPLLAGLVVAALVAIGLAVRPLVADRHARLGQQAFADERYLEAYGEFASAGGWLGHEPGYRQSQASALVALAGAPSTDPELRRSLLDEALIASDQALDRAPDDFGTRLAQADAHLLAAEAATSSDDTDAHLDAAVAILRGLQRDARTDDTLHLPLGRALELRARLGSGDGTRDRADAVRSYQAAEAYRIDRLAAVLGQARVAVDDDRLADAEVLAAEARSMTEGNPDAEAAVDEVDRRIREAN